ncbi:MAG: diguanylate cyclase, partial [Halioglobus sp.]|nr:diguanylate cyclase [Halioglobus sp.]
VARYGGEEFLLILPGASSAAAQHTAARLQELVRQERIAHRASTAAAYLTVSQGVVTARPNAELQPEDLILAADAMLYRAKARGRNAIVVKTPPAG